MALVRDKDGKRLHVKSRLMGESLVSKKCSDMNFDHATLEDVFPVKLSQHLGLGRMNHISEVHMVTHFTFKGYFHRFWNGYACLTCCQS